MRNSIIALLFACAIVGPTAAATVDDLVITAPDRYIVVKGDTLWAISGRFLKSPWRWPELWKNNEGEVRNPNLIYPGDILVLDRTGSQVRLEVLESAPALETVKLSPGVVAVSQPPVPIPAISSEAIAPFLSQPLVVTKDELAASAHIVAMPADRLVLGMGSTAYAQGITQDNGTQWQIFRRGDPLIDPDTKATLGYQAFYLGDANVVKFGNVSTVEIVKSAQEISTGDSLLPMGRDRPVENYMPHAPAKRIGGRIINIYTDLDETGPLGIVVLNRGRLDGLDPGTVLAIFRDLNSPTYQVRSSPLVPYVDEPMGDRNSPLLGRVGPTGGKYPPEKKTAPILPEERYGLLMVFRTFDRVSFALVMDASRPVNVYDTVANP